VVVFEVEQDKCGLGDGADALNLRAYRGRRKAARFSDLGERDPG
jgi:hypothetical protein